MSISVTADGQRIVTASEDSTVRLWDAVSGRELLTLKGHTQPVCSAAMTSDGLRLITGSMDATVKIWEAATPAQLALWAKQDQEAPPPLAAWQQRVAGAPDFIQVGHPQLLVYRQPGYQQRWLNRVRWGD
jgi:WD40 repeat protein